MKEDHFGINVEREYKINHGHKANQIRMSKLTGINAKRISHEKCGLEIRRRLRNARSLLSGQTRRYDKEAVVSGEIFN